VFAKGYCYVMAVIPSIIKSTRLDQDVGFRFVIQHGMNNGFGLERCTTFVFHVLQLPTYCFFFNLKHKYFTFSICYNILHLQIIHLYIHKCHLTLDNIFLFLFDKKIPHFKLYLQHNMLLLKRSKFCIGSCKSIFQTQVVFRSYRNMNLRSYGFHLHTTWNKHHHQKWLKP